MLVVCLVLMALLTVVQVAHVHKNNSDPTQCALCVAMHSAAPVSEAAAIILLVQIGLAVPVLKAQPITRHWNPKLFTRPPPAGC